MGRKATRQTAATREAQDLQRDRFRRAVGLAESRYSYSKLAQAIGKNPSYFSQYLNKFSPDLLPKEVVVAVAQRLGADEAWLGLDDMEDDILAETPASSARHPAVTMELPIWQISQQAAGATGRRMPRPPFLQGANRAFAFVNAFADTAPRYRIGETLLADPDAVIVPGQPGDYALAVVSGDSSERKAVIGEVRQMDSRQLVVAPIDGSGAITVPTAQVGLCAKIVGTISR